MRNGWNFTIETTNGLVGFWTAWSGDGFKLFYPLNINISDEMITETLNVKLANPMLSKAIESRMKTYYLGKLEADGRVWICRASNHCDRYTFRTIEDGQCKEQRMGGSITNTILTCDRFSGIGFEKLKCEEKFIQPYQEKFLRLLIKVAKMVGNVIAVNFDSRDSNSLYNAECLETKGYALKRWRDKDAHLLDEPEEYYYTRDENVEIMIVHFLDLDNEPGATIIRYPATNDLKAENLINLMKELEASKKSNDPIPMLVL